MFYRRKDQNESAISPISNFNLLNSKPVIQDSERKLLNSTLCKKRHSRTTHHILSTTVPDWRSLTPNYLDPSSSKWY